jgi:hypothetical protein
MYVLRFVPRMAAAPTQWNETHARPASLNAAVDVARTTENDSLN